ncbi:MAG: hypothetical protein KKF41_12280 [Actinobacteria bacterium]|nr:hypothetical protein [Actinomycetota bacterium]MBU1945083.1 hypothetical protein [Actinomycetota bacterium]MBU2688352.1 hypothetical protein [Actinomycetota bacterium]
MKKVLLVVMVATLMAAALVLVGCGDGVVTIETEDGEMKISEKKGEVKVSSEEGEATVSSDMPTEAELGVPIYPGAEMEENAAFSTDTASVVVLLTGAPADEVVAWYKDQLSDQPGYQLVGETADTAVLTVQSGDTLKMVTIGKGTGDNSNRTTIGIATEKLPNQ